MFSDDGVNAYVYKPGAKGPLLTATRVGTPDLYLVSPEVVSEIYECLCSTERADVPTSGLVVGNLSNDFSCLDMCLVAKHDTVEILHKRLGHIAYPRLMEFIKSGALDARVSDRELSQQRSCVSCWKSKAHRISFRKKVPRHTVVGMWWYFDVTGKFETPSLTENVYQYGFIESCF